MTPETLCARDDAAVAPRWRRMRRARGLTLVELMLTVTIAGIALAIGSSGWNYYRQRIDIATAVQDIAAMSAVIRMACEDDRVCPATLPASLARRDPWGKPYQYLALGSEGAKGFARKDHSLVPINSDFDLYSMGPDGASSPPLTAKASRDDIVRANDGRFIGVASAY